MIVQGEKNENQTKIKLNKYFLKIYPEPPQGWYNGITVAAIYPEKKTTKVGDGTFKKKFGDSSQVRDDFKRGIRPLRTQWNNHTNTIMEW